MTNYELGFKLQHDCPFNDLSKAHPSVVFSHWCNNEHDMLEASYDNPELYEAIQQSIQETAKKLRVRVSRKVFTGTNQQLVLVHCGCDHYKSVCPTIEKNHCLELQPTIYRDGWEWYRVIAFSDRDIKNLFRDLAEFCKVEIFSRVAKENGSIRDSLIISTSSLVCGLTERQLRALLLAANSGYYRVPKKITTAEIAGLAGVPRTTYEEHLRKAESKILSSLVPYLQLRPQSKLVGTKKRQEIQ
ncbi:MAG TPA: helix-turn-helix domain-containing protein [Nitrososphaerales archaeon]|nr:helix-turn-helix domain-containing protein [Nitrososphaerales archaeon]